MRSLKIVLPLIAAVLAAGAAQADPVKIRLSYVVAPSDWAPLLPEKPDLLKHNGKSYQLEVVRVVGTPALVQAMANNEIEIGNHSYSSLGIAIQNAGMDDLRVISDQFQDGVPGKSTTQYYVLKDGPIQKVEDLKGKVVSSNAAGSAVDVAMRAMLKKHGLEDKRDYTFIEAALPAQKAMLLDKKTDLISSVVPFQHDPELKAKGRILFTQRDIMRRHADDRVDRAQELHRQEPRRDGRLHGGQAARRALVSRPEEPRRGGGDRVEAHRKFRRSASPGCSPTRTTPATAT